MRALVSYLSMSYEGVDYKWTAGEDYEITDNGDTLSLTSDWGSGEVPKRACLPELFSELFGLDITA